MILPSPPPPGYAINNAPAIYAVKANSFSAAAIFHGERVVPPRWQQRLDAVRRGVEPIFTTRRALVAYLTTSGSAACAAFPALPRLPGVSLSHPYPYSYLDTCS